MIRPPHPGASDILAYMKRVEEARKLLAESAQWLTTVPAIPGTSGAPAEVGEAKAAKEAQEAQEAKGTPKGRYSGAVLDGAVLSILEESGNPYRAQMILAILQQGGMEFLTENPVFEIAGVLKRAYKAGKLVKKGKGWWRWKQVDLEDMDRPQAGAGDFGDRNPSTPDPPPPTGP